MKAFVIKNKEGKYFGYYDSENNRYEFSKKPVRFITFNTLRDANKIKNLWKMNKCEVVEIEIQETKEKYFIRDCAFENLRLQKENLEQQLDKSEQELAFYQDEIKNRGTCGLCEKLENKQIKELKQQLAEKDKEIEELKEFYDNMLRNKLEVKCVSATEEKIKEIRKQVCDEIRKLAHNDFEFVVCDECYNTIDKDVYLSSRDLTKILDQIEQAKESLNGNRYK